MFWARLRLILDFDWLVISYDSHFSLVYRYFSGLKYILARQISILTRKMRHNARQSDDNIQFNQNDIQSNQDDILIHL